MTPLPVDRSQFTLYGQHVFSMGGLEVDAAVIGASHIITYHTSHWQLTEVLACVPLEGTTCNMLSELTKPIRHSLPSGTYEFSTQRIKWVDPEPPALVWLVEAASRSHNLPNQFGIVQEFPIGSHMATPKTVIFGQRAATGTLIILTAHSYPNVPGLVMSRTLIRS